MKATASAAISVRGLCKDYDGVEILRDISFDVPQGTTTCLLGPSGSGKSTLLRCINWLEVPGRGTIELGGQPIGRIGEGAAARPMSRAQLAAARGRIGTVFQSFALWPHMTVLQNVMAAPLHVHGRAAAEVRGEAMALLEQVGLADKADSYPHRLSGGQKQRVAITRALAGRGMTMLVVTHEMGFAREVSDQVVFLDGGKLVETGSPEVFFQQPRTERARKFLARYTA